MRIMVNNVFVVWRALVLPRLGQCRLGPVPARDKPGMQDQGTWSQVQLVLDRSVRYRSWVPRVPVLDRRLLGHFVGKEPLHLKQVAHFTGKRYFIGHGIIILQLSSQKLCLWEEIRIISVEAC